MPSHHTISQGQGDLTMPKTSYTNTNAHLHEKNGIKLLASFGKRQHQTINFTVNKHHLDQSFSVVFGEEESSNVVSTPINVARKPQVRHIGARLIPRRLLQQYILEYDWNFAVAVAFGFYVIRKTWEISRVVINIWTNGHWHRLWFH